MMMSANEEMVCSQLADGELPSDKANELLLGVLDDPARREKLKELLRLRQATAEWRSRQPARPVMVVAERARALRRMGGAWRLGGLAVAACVGGLLVMAGVWAAGWIGAASRAGEAWQPIPQPAAARVSPEQMQQVAKVFALHESVAGPLAWYAADDQNIRLASARGTEAGQIPIGVLLKLESASPGSSIRTLMIVCRNGEPTVVELPGESSGQAGLRVYLSPRAVNGKVEMTYAIAVDGLSKQGPAASISGQRRLGTAESALGQLAMGERLLNVEAAAWPMKEGVAP